VIAFSKEGKVRAPKDSSRRWPPGPNTGANFISGGHGLMKGSGFLVSPTGFVEIPPFPLFHRKDSAVGGLGAG